jgi:hypothetical protein
MHLIKTCVLLATSAYAFTVPNGQPDGSYSVTYAADGTETHTLIKLYTGEPSQSLPRNPFNGSPSSQAKKERRQVPNSNNNISCGGYFLDVGETNAANAELDAQ